MKPFISSQSLYKEKDNISIELLALSVGNDLVIVIAGGDKAHIGASALSQPRASLENPDKISASTSVMCVLGHKEDLLAHHIAQKLSATFNCVVNVTCGIHIDNADSSKIKITQTLVNELLDDFISRANQP
ncbi:prenylated flavin chaperone LpdD [Vibrio salinus]|uniref:prenylated flavin chaperone LpdD n=1 Tax=Vibrio salinus TaxID=2899784 RepID=UPI001E53F0F0|nr:hypothetical protein [Vibrio salinus]MCE0494695.1 hypothetical protein [Vibrio salinus]